MDPLTVILIAVGSYLLGAATMATLSAASQTGDWTDDEPVDYQLTDIAEATGVLIDWTNHSDLTVDWPNRSGS